MVLKEACFVAEEDICAAPVCKTLLQNKIKKINNFYTWNYYQVLYKKFEVKVKVNSR